MKILIFLNAIISLGFISLNPGATEPLFRAKGADKIYAERKSEPLNAEESKAVGMWAGENKEVKWEMLRNDDGTYGLVLHERYEGTLYKDYIKGIWGIKGNAYYYQDLETNNDLGFYPATYETVVDLTLNEFRYESKAEDGNIRMSIERRVKQFHFDLWNEYSQRGKKTK